MRKHVLKNSLVVGIIFLFIFGGIIPAITGYDKEVEQTSIILSSNVIEIVEDTTITFYLFMKTGVKIKNLVVSSDDFKAIIDIFEALKYEMIHHPLGDEIQSLKREFIDLIEENNLIPEGVHKEDIFSLLNPMWIQRIQNNDAFTYRIPPLIVNSNRANAFLCSMISEGFGWIVPPIMIPRPRIVNGWITFEGNTAVAELYRLRGFIASGAHLGLSVGFIGAGIAFALPGLPPFYGFVGYSLFTTVDAASIELYPPNAAPVISDENPPNGAKYVSVSLSELSFRIADGDGDRLSYSVTTDPNIGSGSGSNKPDGTYSIPITGLEGSKEYNWYIEVSDGKKTVFNSFSFSTVPDGPIISDIIPLDGEEYIDFDLSKLTFTLRDFQGDNMDFTVETSPRIGSGSGNGVGDGKYSVNISNLDYYTDYNWYVNVTDGIHWTRGNFSFKTRPKGMIILNPTDDATIIEGDPNNNFGSNIQVKIRRAASPWTWVGLIEFDLSMFGSETDLIKADLMLYYYNYKDGNPVGRKLNLYRINSDWDEETVTWNNQPAYTTQPSSHAIVPSSPDNWIEWNVTNDVLAFIAEEEFNNGWKITDENSGGYPIIRFRSKEYEENIPKLIVWFNE